MCYWIDLSALKLLEKAKVLNRCSKFSQSTLVSPTYHKQLLNYSYHFNVGQSYGDYVNGSICNDIANANRDALINFDSVSHTLLVSIHQFEYLLEGTTLPCHLTVVITTKEALHRIVSICNYLIYTLICRFLSISIEQLTMDMKDANACMDKAGDSISMDKYHSLLETVYQMVNSGMNPDKDQICNSIMESVVHKLIAICSPYISMSIPGNEINSKLKFGDALTEIHHRIFKFISEAINWRYLELSYCSIKGMSEFNSTGVKQSHRLFYNLVPLKLFLSVVFSEYYESYACKNSHLLDLLTKIENLAPVSTFSHCVHGHEPLNRLVSIISKIQPEKVVNKVFLIERNDSSLHSVQILRYYDNLFKTLSAERFDLNRLGFGHSNFYPQNPFDSQLIRKCFTYGVRSFLYCNIAVKSLSNTSPELLDKVNTPGSELQRLYDEIHLTQSPEFYHEFITNTSSSHCIYMPTFDQLKSILL